MTLLGLGLVLVGFGVGITAGALFNGQWLLGAILATIGIALTAIDRKDGPLDH